ncbi:MAG TPA: DUF5657 family protein [Patescibacteria group bacterium]|nr:DUF5657 family protein [Patescibacteria group bacterium]
MNFQLFTDGTATVMMIVKIFIIITLISYAVFAFILYQQMIVKHRTVETPRGPFLITVALVHLFVSLVLLLVSFILL